MNRVYILLIIISLFACTKETPLQEQPLSNFIVYNEDNSTLPYSDSTGFTVVTYNPGNERFLSFIDTIGVKHHLLKLNDYMPTSYVGKYNIPFFGLKHTSNSNFIFLDYSDTLNADTLRMFRVIKASKTGTFNWCLIDSFKRIENKTSSYINYYPTDNDGIVIITFSDFNPNLPGVPPSHKLRFTYYGADGNYLTDYLSDSLKESFNSSFKSNNNLFYFITENNGPGAGQTRKLLITNDKAQIVARRDFPVQFDAINAIREFDDEILISSGAYDNNNYYAYYLTSVDKDLNLNWTKKVSDNVASITINRLNNNILLVGWSGTNLGWIRTDLTGSNQQEMEIKSNFWTQGFAAIVRNNDLYIVGYKNSFGLYDNMFFLKTKF